MKKSWQREMARRFPENGVKLLLENRRNVRDLFTLTEDEVVSLIDFDRLQKVQGTFIMRDFRHVEADVVLTAPYRPEGVLRRLWLYLLIEHQSEPDAFMPLRLHDYVIQLFKRQQREWLREHGSIAGLRLQPVLPLVFYTGTERWESIGKLVDLIEQGDQFREVTPAMKPLFVNLSGLRRGLLESEGGSFGQVMRLVRGRTLPLAEFGRLLDQVAAELEGMPVAERVRRQELLSYLSALVYHGRDPVEHRALHERLEEAARTDQFRRELITVRQTMAEVLMAEGQKKGEKRGEIRARREDLLRLLQNRFGEVPAQIETRVKAVRDLALLREWFDRASTAATLNDVGIVP